MNNLADTTTNPDTRFWNRIAKRYARRPVADQQAYEVKLAKTDSYLKPTHHMLEIGCGTGTTAIHHAPKVARVRAIDISEKMIEIARTKATEANVTNIDFEVTSIDNLCAASNSFDVILAHSILHLLPDVARVLRQQYQMLKPAGILISSTSCIGDSMPLFRYLMPVGRRLGLMPYVNVFSEQDLKQWLADTGFVVEERWQPNPKSAIYIVARKTGVKF